MWRAYYYGYFANHMSFKRQVCHTEIIALLENAVKAENRPYVHTSLRFFGEVDSENVESICGKCRVNTFYVNISLQGSLSFSLLPLSMYIYTNTQITHMHNGG